MKTAIVWFRRDLRLSDNPALTKALTWAEQVIPLFIYDHNAPECQCGGASRWWLHHSLDALAASLQQRGSRLLIRRGPSETVLNELIQQSGSTAVFWNRLYEPEVVGRDKRLKQGLREQGLTVESFNAALLFEPWQVFKDNGEPYRVFTPYWNSLQRCGLPQQLLPAPAHLPAVPKALDSSPLSSLQLLPRLNWAEGFPDYWQPGETGAREKLESFIDTALDRYRTQRDIPADAGTSRLSPHLHFGEISPRQIVASINEASHSRRDTGLLASAESYLRELSWREFAYYLLFHFPQTQSEPYNPRFDTFQWDADNPAHLKAWQSGQTGIPIVDAGMRELWQTGWMHNRVRMIVASLLTKNLLQHWLQGAHWFMDTLVDADLAANTMGWQWVAGCGADAAPYFRVFNPVLQGQKFDPRGRYVRQWVPELKALPDKYLHSPWTAPDSVLTQSGVQLGNDYPQPIVDLKHSRAEALSRYNRLKLSP